MRGSAASVADCGAGTGANETYRRLLAFYDAMVSAVVIGPAVVGCWRGTWQLMEHYVFTENREHSLWVSLLIGFLGHFVFTMLQHPLARLFHPDYRRLTYYAVSRGYSVVFGFCCVNAWRGVWNMLDVYTGKHIWPVSVIFVISVIALILMRALRNISAPPFAVVTDAAEGYFEIHTMFRNSKNSATYQHVLDVFFSVVFVGSLVVFVWRGAWVLVDIQLYPSNATRSAWASLGLGYAVVVVAFCLQPLMKRVCNELEHYPRLALSDLYILFSFVGTINVWRGIWNLLNIYLLPETPVISFWVSYGACLTLLLLLNCSNSVLVRGVYIDADDKEGGDCVLFPVSYITTFVQQERELSLQRRGQHPTLRRKGDIENKVILLQDQQANNTGNHVHMQLVNKAGGDAREDPTSDA